MNNPENPYMRQFQIALNEAIAKAIKPFRDDNRQLRFVVGMATQWLSIRTDEEPSQILDALMKISAHRLQDMPDSISADLMILAGQQFGNVVSSIYEKEETQEGDRQPTATDEDLLEILQCFSLDIFRWFSCRYASGEIPAPADVEDPDSLFHRHIAQYPLQAMALEMAERINIAIPRSGNYEILIRKKEGD